MKRIRYAVVGIGQIAQTAVLPAFEQAENSELAALITGNAEKGRELSLRYAVPAYSYAEFEVALRERRIDAVFITVPNTLHREYTERAAALGVHVLCEKPMATTESDCQAMIAACSRAHVHLMIGYRLHLTAAHVRAADLARSGRLGDLRAFNSIFTQQTNCGIRLEAALGGGPLFDIGIYCINAARYLFGDEPNEVQAVAASAEERRFDQVEEMVSAILRFPQQRLASFTCSFGAYGINQFELVGTEGSLRMEPAYASTVPLKWEVKMAGETESVLFPQTDQFAGELIYFSDCIETGLEPEPSGAHGLADVRIVSALYRSIQEAKPVLLPDLSPRGDAVSALAGI